MISSEFQQLGEIGRRVLEHQLEQVGSDRFVQTFLFQESEDVVDTLSVERNLAVLAVQVFESMTEEGAEIFWAEV